MYRNSASMPPNHVVTSAASSKPSRDSDESDSEISRLLDQKRQDLEQEIALFKATKDQEFLDFEKGLLRSRQRRKKDARAKKGSSKPRDGTKQPGALSLLAGASTSTPFPNGDGLKSEATNQSSERSERAKVAPSSNPTVSVDRSNVKGHTTPPVEGSPTPSDKMTRQKAKSPESHGIASTARAGREAKPVEPAAPTDDSHDSFAGVFTPSYLPLLESRQNEKRTATRPTDVKIQRHNSFSHSQSSSEIFSPVLRSQRSHTAPIIPSTSLPSALRTASGTAIRKRKHVTFQLADSAIVEPSSSYEELPSPEPKDESKEGVDGISEVLSNGANEQEGPAEDVDDTIFPPRFGQKPLRSPTIRGREHSGQTGFPFTDPNLSPRSLESDMQQAADGGSGVGFFELDEEIASPGFGEIRPFESEDGIESDSQGALEEKRKNSRDDLDLDEEAYVKNTYEYSGSVPINISRPSGSWIGSFGH